MTSTTIVTLLRLHFEDDYHARVAPVRIDGFLDDGVIAPHHNLVGYQLTVKGKLAVLADLAAQFTEY